jgi:hypothetical protein
MSYENSLAVNSTSGFSEWRTASAPAVSPAGQSRIYFDGVNLKVSENGGAFANLTGGGGAGGWTDDGTVVRLTTSSDQVGLGTAAPAGTSKFEVLGDATFKNVLVTGGAPAGAAIGGAFTVVGGAGGATSGVGGAISLTGGTGTAGNSAGGASSLTAGAGQGTATGGAVSMTGGQGGSTGAGGAGTVQAGAGGSTSGDGGSVTVAGGTVTSGTAGSVIFTTAAIERNRVTADGASNWTGIVTASAPALSAAGNGRIFFDSTLSKFRVSQSAGAYTDLVGSANAFVQDGNAFAALASLGTTDANALRFITSNTDRGRFLSGGGLILGGTAAVGAETLRQTAGTTLFDFTSTTSFQVAQTGGGVPALVVDTTNTRVGVGAAPGAFTLDVTGTARVSTSTQTPQVQAASAVTLNLGGGASNQVALSGSTSGGTALTLTQPVSTTGSPTAALVTGGAHTTLTASAEAIDVNLNLARTVQFSTGALTTQRAVVVQAPTYGFVGASTLTNAATVAIAGPPVAGTNATITNPYALWAQAGQTRVAGFTAGVVTKTANYSLTADDFTIRANNGGGGAITMTLPAVGDVRGRIYVIKRVNGGGGAANSVIVAAAGGETIDGVASSTMGSQYAVLRLQAPDTGTDWMVI